jgi:hypothetical protein
MNKMQRFQYLKARKAYLAQLSTLCGRLVLESELSSIEAAAEMRESSRRLASLPKVDWRSGFDEYRERMNADIVSKLKELNPAPVSIWTEYTITCGYVTLQSISDINFKFEENFANENVLVIATIDLTDRLVLDFQRADAKTDVAISFQGENWSKIQII